MELAAFQIGDIVAIKSHQYEAGLTSIIFGGDPLHQSPLMIVIEILLKEEENKQTEYKCIWYSSRNQSFEEIWLTEVCLKLIEKANISNSLTQLSTGDRLLFRTVFLEFSKRKSSTAIEGKLNQISKSTSITPLLSFSSPAFIAIKEPEINKANYRGSRKGKHIIDKSIVKVKWYNSSSGKFSEYFLPFACFTKIVEVNYEKLLSFQNAINSGSFVLVRLADSSHSIIMPTHITFINGGYFIRFSDLLNSKQNAELPIEKLDLMPTENELLPLAEFAPEFDFTQGAKPIKPVEDLLTKGVAEKKVVRIKYKNQLDEVTTRCIKNYSINNVPINGNGVFEFFLTGDCLLRRKKRHFNVSRISHAELLPIEWQHC